MHICFTYLHVCHSNAEFYFTCTWSKVLFSVPFLAILREKNTYDTCKWSRIEIEKGKSNQIFSLTCYLILLKKSKILTRERKDIWQWFILGKFDILTSIKKFSLKFFLTITMFNKNANKKKTSRYSSTLKYQVCSCQGSIFFFNETEARCIKKFQIHRIQDISPNILISWLKKYTNVLFLVSYFLLCHCLS